MRTRTWRGHHPAPSPALDIATDVPDIHRAAVERGGDGGQVVWAVPAEVGALGEVLAQEPVGVLVRAALPGRVGSQK